MTPTAESNTDPAEIAAGLQPLARAMLRRAVDEEAKGWETAVFTRCPSVRLSRLLQRDGLVACCPLDGDKEITPTALGRAVAAHLENVAKT